MTQLTATSNAQHYLKMLCTMITKPPSKFYVDFKKYVYLISSKITKLSHTFFFQMFCALSGRSLIWNTPVFCRFTAREHAKLLFIIMCFDPYHSKAQLSKYCGKRAFLGVAKSWTVTLDRVPWFGRHVENLSDVIMYPVLARTGGKERARRKKGGEEKKKQWLHSLFL